MPTEELTQDDVVRRLKLDYIQQLGDDLREMVIEQRLPTAVAYEPGDHTRYDLVFVAANDLTQLVAGMRVPEGLRGPGGTISDGWIVVSKVNGARTWAYPFDLSKGNRAMGSYVSSHTDGNYASGCAVSALFRAVARVPLLDSGQ